MKKLISLAVAGACLFSSASASEVKEIEAKSSVIVEENQENDLYLVDRRELSDGLTGGVLVAETGASILTLDPSNLDEEERGLINSADNIYILGGEDRISSDFESLENFKARYSGQDRYETATTLAEVLGTDRDLLIVNGTNYIDALASGSMAALEDRNILLVEEDQVPEATRIYLESYGLGKDIIFIGGEASLSPQVKKQVLGICGIEAELEDLTLAGADRYETSLAIGKRADLGTNPVLVDGQDLEMVTNAINFYGSADVGLLVSGENNEEILGAYEESHGPGLIYAIGTRDLVNEEKPVQAELAGELLEEEVEEKAPSNPAQAFIDEALKMEGWAYSQSARMAEGSADCSSLVMRSLINSGLSKDTRNLTSETIFSDPRFERISFDEMRAGDVLYMPGHLAIFMGEGRVFEAKTWGVPAGYGSYAHRGWTSVFRISGI